MFDWDDAARRNDIVVFSDETVVAVDTGRTVPAFFTDGHGQRFRFKRDYPRWVIYQSVDNDNAFKLLKPNLSAFNVTRRMFAAAENCLPKVVK